ncbi:MAG: DUF1476 family protein [Rhodospirillales bacterium]|nr:DUF1476 family protein [Alphaproteobacteria bacterium]MBL6929123.1 DUF1476 family protein [Rhodospirillales bacterium]
MTGNDNAFDDRKKSQEAKYKMDEERQFKLRARRNKLLGLWAAAQMGLSDAEAAEFAKEAVMIGLEAPNDEQFILRLCKRAGEIDESRLVEELSRAEEQAEKQIAAEFPTALDTDHEQVGG